MTAATLDRATDIYGRALRERPFQRVLKNLGVTHNPVRISLAQTSVGEFLSAFPDITTRPVIVIDQERGRIARLDFYLGCGSEGIPVNGATEMGMIVDCIQALHRDITADQLGAAVHSQTREFDFA